MKLPFCVDLKGKTAVVTGGGGVLTGGFAKALAACGAKVAVLDIDLEAAGSVVKEIERSGGTALAVCADCLDKKSLISAAAEIESKFGKADILVNGAGGNSAKGTCSVEKAAVSARGEGDFFALDKEGLEFVLDINILSAFLSSQVFAEGMRNRGGCIINVSSMNAYRPLTKIPAYSAAKAGVSNFTQWLAVHLAPCNIRVNAIAPGFFSTKQNKNLLFSPDGAPTERTAKILAHTPMDRLGVPEDLTGALLFLCSERASGFITGIILPVDGGFSAYSGV